MADNDMLTGFLAGQSDSNGSGNGGGMFNGDAFWGIILLALLFGNRGFGGGNGNNDGGGSGWGWGGCRGPWATQEDVRAAVDQQTLISKLDQQTYGLADTFTALNNNLNSNFRGIDNAICTLGFQSQQGFSGLSSQLAACCCDIERGIERNTTQGIMNTNAIQQQISNCCCDLEKANMQNRFDAQTYNCNTLQAIDKLGDRIIGFMSNEKMQTLRDENQALRLAASQAKQNQYLVNELRPCPVPAYITCNPYAASWGFGNSFNGLGFGRDGSCGCGSCC